MKRASFTVPSCQRRRAHRQKVAESSKRERGRRRRMGFPFENRRPVVFAVFADKIETVSGLSLSIHGNPNEAWSKIRLTANRAHGSRREDSERAIDHEDLTLLDVFD